MAKSQTEKTSDLTLKILSAILKEIGIYNFIVVFIAFFILMYATDKQKEQIISCWILLESTNHLYCYIVILTMGAVTIVGGVHYRILLRNARKELIRIGQEKSDLQEKLLQSNLATSKKKQP